MNLKRWFDKTNMTQRELAELAGKHYMHIYKIKAGRRGASLGLMAKIEKITGGDVYAGAKKFNHPIHLRSWLNENNITEKEYAKLVNIHSSTIYKVCAGQRPTLRLQVMTEKITGGQLCSGAGAFSLMITS